MPRRAALLLLLFAAPARADEPDFAKLEAAVAEEMKSANVPGAAVAVVRGDKVIFAKGFGVRSVETTDPVTPDTLFRLGSTTKVLTAAGVVKLAEAGKLALGAPLHKYVADLPVVVAHVSAHQLLTHTAGLTDEAPMFGPPEDAALARGIRAWKADYRFAEPGTVYSYSNPGYWAAGLLLETVAGEPYADAMRTQVFAPLGMKRTCLRPTVAITHPVAVGHDAEGGKATVIRPAADSAATRPAGQVFSSANDLSRFAIAFLNGGRLDGKPALPPGAIEKLGTGYVEVPGRPAKYGYGLVVTTVRGVKILEHGGARAGYGSFLRLAPEQKVAVIVLANRTGAQMPKTVEAASELILPLEPKPKRAEPDGKPVGEEEAAKLVGRYTNNRQTVTVARTASGQLELAGGSLGGTYTRVAGWQFAAGSRRVVFTARSDGPAEFLHSGGRALARVRADGR